MALLLAGLLGLWVSEPIRAQEWPYFRSCMAGPSTYPAIPGHPRYSPSAWQCLVRWDFDDDGDVDLGDYAFAEANGKLGQCEPKARPP